MARVVVGRGREWVKGRRVVEEQEDGRMEDGDGGEVNVEMNLTAEEQKRVKVEKLKWGEPIPASCLPCDLILAADCVYLESAFDPLIETLLALSTPSTVILIVSKRRRKADKRFFVKLRKHFKVEEVTDVEGFEKWSREGLTVLSARKIVR
ncbi:putative methyltransferase-domain-containing protein [Chytridium lagenaria]|nr:putative methyltransferase-domain-containing protein [Chytridium lagenaria]